MILIADDDAMIAALISDALEDAGYRTRVVHDGDAVLALVRKEPDEIELILLDIMMPGTDGLEVCRRIRQTVHCPILFVSARDTQVNRIVGLEIGADDYITKPFSVAELVARVNAHIRREKRTREGGRTEAITIGRLKLLPDAFTATMDGAKLDLSTREFQVLLYLARNRTRVLSREQILEGVQGNAYSDLNAVTVHVRNIRTKLGANAGYIQTVWGVGYKLVNPEATA